MQINDFRSAGLESLRKCPAAGNAQGEDPSQSISDSFEKQDKSNVSVEKTLSRIFSKSADLSENKDVETKHDIKTVQFADYQGRIKHLALMLSNYAGGEMREQMLDAYKTLFKNMEPDTKFTIVVGSERDRRDVERVVNENNIENPERIKFIKPDHGGLTVWARDMMVGLGVKDDPDHTALLKQSMLHDWHGSDVYVPDQIVKENPSIILDAEPKLVTDGGDVMSNRDKSFIGNYSFSATSEKIARLSRSNPKIKEEVMEFYENISHKNVKEHSGSDNSLFPFRFVPDKTVPPDTHEFNFKLSNNPEYVHDKTGKNEASEEQMYEDLALKLFEEHLGKPVSVMGMDDPTTEHKEEPATDHLDMGLTPIGDKTFLLGDPTIFKNIIASMSPEEKKDAEKKISKMAGKEIDIESLSQDQKNNNEPKDFDAYEKTLKEKGYDVIRLPHADPKWFDPYISYNNCLMECFERDGAEIKRVFLPTYDIEKMDNYAINKWNEQGFEVYPIRLDVLSQRKGALRCISNCLERSDS